MGMKFLNKKGWHTGSLRNIENVWKAEQKNDAEQKKLEELRKQIIEERERSEFRLLQEQAGLLPKQERLDFLYDSGLAVGKGSSDGFKDLQSLPKKPENELASSSSANVLAVPGALFEDKPQSANDSWRKLHSDPLLMIRQREQEALARVRNNPVQMAMIHKSIEAKKSKSKGDKKESKKHREKKSKHKRRHSSPSDSENGRLEAIQKRKRNDRNSLRSDDHIETRQDSQEVFTERESQRMKNRGTIDSRCEISPIRNIIEHDTERNDNHHKPRDFERSKHDRYSFDGHSHPKSGNRFNKERRDYEDDFVDRKSQRKKNSDDIELEYEDNTSRAKPGSEFSRSDSHRKPLDFERSKHDRSPIIDRPNSTTSSSKYKENSSSLSRDAVRNDTQHKRRTTTQKISEEERAARLQAMQKDAELHEAQRWTRIKKADEDDAREATQKLSSSGKNFLDAAKTSVYGAGEKGNFTIEESVRRRAHYSQGRSEANAGSAFRR